MANDSRLGDLYAAAKRVVPGPLRRSVRRVAFCLPRRLVGTVTHVRTEEPVVALTFDDGPHPVHTVRFLHVLEQHRARGTFFLLGRSARRYPELVARIVQGGHAVGNHSWDHPSFPAISEHERRQQIRACGRAIGDPAVKLFRPPYGDQTWTSRLTPMRLGWQVVTWSVSGSDWRGDSADCIAQRILAGLRPGAIVLLHDVLHHYEDARFAPRDATLAALTMVLRASAGRYRFVTVPELLRRGRPQRELWLQPGQADYLAGLKQDESQASRDTTTEERWESEKFGIGS